MEVNERTVAIVGSTARPASEAELSQAVSEIEFQAGTIFIDNEADYAQAAEFGRALKRSAAEVKAFFQPMKDAAHRAHKEICDREKTMLKPLENAERVLKQTMGNYVQECERKRLAAEAAARKAAEEEAERRLQEAIDLAESGDTALADIALEEAQLMQDAAGSVSLAETKPKAEGTSTRRDWEIVNIDTNKVPVIFAGMELRPVDTAAVMRLIRSSKGTIQIDGITYKEKSTISFRK